MKQSDSKSTPPSLAGLRSSEDKILDVVRIRIHRTETEFTRVYFVEFCLSPDCRALALNGRCLYEFTPSQAMIVEILIEHLEQGITKVPHALLLSRLLGDAITKDSLVKSYFKSGKILHPAWGTFIKSTGGRDASVYLDFECLI